MIHIKMFVLIKKIFLTSFTIFKLCAFANSLKHKISLELLLLVLILAMINFHMLQQKKPKILK